ncbi:MAG: endolytic transglycosylase MltG [Candidatus Saccharimonadales bacterium]
MDNFKRPHPQRPQQQPNVSQTPPPRQLESVPQETPAPAEQPPLQIKKTHKVKHWLLGLLAAVVVLLIVAGVGAFMWYNSNLASPQPEDDSVQRVTIEEGSAISTISHTLESEGLIKNAYAFQIYYRLHGQQPLQAGDYTLARNLDTPGIITELAEGKNREYSLTFLPGENLMDIQETLKKAGFDDETIEAAFSKQYPAYTMMQQRPPTYDIEGFVFPDTYSFGQNYTVEDILQRPFEHMQAYIVEQDLEAAYKEQGLTLYEGIILASIIQKEVNNQSDMGHVSQVFHRRLKENMPLGSDPTFVFPAKKEGIQPLPTLDSPYNTYKVTGLPPGPIANPGKEALYAAAHPSTDTDDLYFVAGDDGKTHFSKTNEEHEALTKQYCQERCRLDIF